MRPDARPTSRQHAIRACLAMALFAAVVLAAAAQELPRSLGEASLTPEVRAQLYQRARNLRAMDPARRQDFERAVADWRALPEARRRDRRERWQAWQALPETERRRLQAAATRFAALPVEQQLELRRRYAVLDAGLRHGWLLGPVLGADWAHLQPLLMQVPEAQREPLLAVLRALSPAERADLGVLAQRVPPQERDALRRELIAQPAASRARWLEARLRN